MKNLIFLLIGFFCFANGQNSDSLQIKLMELEQKNQKIESLIQKAEIVEKKHESAFFKLKSFIKNLVSDDAKGSAVSFKIANREGVKKENPTDPVTEIDILSGIDTIQGGWIYRLLHKENFYLKRYKIVNNEKVYLD